MAAAVVSDSFVTVLGPMKAEIVNFSDIEDTDTYTTTIQNPQFGFFVSTEDGGEMTASVNLGIVGRVVTFNSADLDTLDTGVAVIFGF